MPDNKDSSNQAKIREALDKLLNFLRWAYAQDYPVSRDKLADAIDIGVSALSAPPRNCDVGTAEEQYARVRSFCKRHKVGLRCVDCPVNGVFPKNCALIWAQMPYEEGEGEMRKVRYRNGSKENCCHGKSLVTDAVQAVEKL